MPLFCSTMRPQWFQSINQSQPLMSLSSVGFLHAVEEFVIGDQVRVFLSIPIIRVLRVLF